jgi:hypothetical protein
VDFVLTADVDWASEDCIETFLQIAARFSIRPTIFITHESEILKRAHADGCVELGVHPNFLAGSDHGADAASVIDSVLRLAPEAVAVRAHRYIGSPQISALLAARGLSIDSNLCRHLAVGITPETLPTGSVRLPVFFEDDIHWTEGHGWDFEIYRHAFFSPGLKVLNFHPFFVTLNVPDAAFYQRHKHYIRTLTKQHAARLAHRGGGAHSFLIKAITAVQAAGHRFVTLGELANGLKGRDHRKTAPPAEPLEVSI